LFTDLERSSQLWEQDDAAMETSLAEHDVILREAIATDGRVFSTMGDGVAAAFTTAGEAVNAAVAAQRALRSHAWGRTGPLRVRMGVHVGTAQHREGDYFGRTLNRCARLMAVGHGGQILVSSAARAELPGDVEVVDLGLHRLRDLSEPEHVFQVVANGLDDQFPPLQSLNAQSGNLPLQPTSFVGRDAEVAAISAALAVHRVVTLSGVGGVGKTRLAVQVAAEMSPRFTGGTWLCELAPIGDPAAVPHALAAVLGVQPTTSGSISDALLSHLARADVLIVIDNCEHLLDAVCSLIEAIVYRCPGVVVLATSREPLGVDGETIIPVKSLPLEASAQLFGERALAIRGDLVGTSDEVSVNEICTRLDGVPLAIELAAARVASMTPVEIAARLDERFRLLTGGRRTALERHRTLRGAVDWSFDLLQPAEQRVLARLSVFAGGFTLDAAEEIAADEEMLGIDAVESLVKKSMVVAEVANDGQRSRYTMLETIRQYAEEHLVGLGEADAIRLRHTSYFVAFAEAGRRASRTAEEVQWSPRIEAERANFRAALAWATESDHAVFAARVLDALFIHAWFHLWSEFDGWARSVVNGVERTADVPSDLAARVVAQAAIFAWGASDLARAQEYVDQGMGQQNRGDLATALLHLARASVALTSGDVGAAVTDDQAAVEFAIRAHDDWWSALNKAHLTLSTAASGDAASAAAVGLEALLGARATQSATLVAYCAFALADSIIDDDPDAAVQYLEEAGAVVEAADISFMVALTRMSLVTAQGRSAEPRRSVAGYIQLLDQWRTGVTVAHLRATLRNAAEMLARIGRPEVAAFVHGAMERWGTRPPAGSPEAIRLAAAVDTARQTFGTEFDALVARGRSLTDDEVVSVVREVLTEVLA
jgi:predicted ATPase